MSSDSLDISTLDDLTSDFSVEVDTDQECSSPRNVPAESSPQGILLPYYNISSTMTMSELKAAFFLCKFLE